MTTDEEELAIALVQYLFNEKANWRLAHPPVVRTPKQFAKLKRNTAALRDLRQSGVELSETLRQPHLKLKMAAMLAKMDTIIDRDSKLVEAYLAKVAEKASSSNLEEI
jgi:hypothetical protein